jgi:hypothetical protein
MNGVNENNEQNVEAIFPATVVALIDPYKVAINRGLAHGIKMGQRFLIYRLSRDEIKDPSNGKLLGYLEIVKGTGKVIHIQDQMSTIESDQRSPAEKKIVRTIPSFFSADKTEEEITPPTTLRPFEDPAKGDKAKPI